MNNYFDYVVAVRKRTPTVPGRTMLFLAPGFSHVKSEDIIVYLGDIYVVSDCNTILKESSDERLLLALAKATDTLCIPIDKVFKERVLEWPEEENHGSAE